ncbi:MAG: hypothetical protein JNN15_09450 [Blastocatellia bacterium]|nr:hypothetical protein [Blastocatellia bacterium]
MQAHEYAKRQCLLGRSPACALLEGLRHDKLIDFSDILLDSTLAFGRGLDTPACLLAASMAVGLAASKEGDLETQKIEAEKLSLEIFNRFRQKYQTTRYSEIPNLQDLPQPQRRAFESEMVEFTTQITAELLTCREISHGKLSLTHFVNYLGNYSLDELTLERVEQLMSRLQVQPKEIEECVNFSEEGYARNLFFRNENFEVLVMCWAAGQSSPIHDHNQSYSVEMVYRGDILCNNYVRTDQSSDAITESRSMLAKQGEIITGNVGDIHRIANPSKETKAISIHFYSPPLKKMRVYSLTSNRSQWTNLRYLYIYRPEVWESLGSCNL